jgi:exodeoxyribonuclease VII large subunit
MLRGRPVLRRGVDILIQRRQVIDHLTRDLRQAVGKSHAMLATRFGTAVARLDALSPLKILGRGYAIVQTAEGHLVKSWSDVALEDTVGVKLSAGSLICTVAKRIEP